MKSCSLTIVCVIVLVVILCMIFSGSRNNMYRLIEGYDTKEEKDKKEDKKEEKKEETKNTITKAIESGPLSAVTPILKIGGGGSEKETEKESFQVRKPIGYADIVKSRSDNWNLSNWVKSALRYSKGMGNENKLDGYKYHTGPKIPLPEGELFFFNNTKFDWECCPSTYSNSKGCACLSQPQFNHLMMRGGNHTPPKNTNTSYYNDL
jgi:hypothetical protein